MMERQRAHVLLVDDEVAFTRVLAKILEHQGFVVSTAADAREALDFLQMVEPDVIVLDVRMPGLSGVDALPRIRAVRPKTPVIMLTGHASLEDAAQAIAAGAFDVLHKPCDTAALVACLHAAVTSSRAQSLRAVDVLVPVEQCLVVPESWNVGRVCRALGEGGEDRDVVVMDGSCLVGVWSDHQLAMMVAEKPLPAVWSLPVSAVSIAPHWVEGGTLLAAVAVLVARYEAVAVRSEGTFLGLIGVRQVRAAVARWARSREV